MRIFQIVFDVCVFFFITERWQLSPNAHCMAYRYDQVKWILLGDAQRFAIVINWVSIYENAMHFEGGFDDGIDAR